MYRQKYTIYRGFALNVKRFASLTNLARAVRSAATESTFLVLLPALIAAVFITETVFANKVKAEKTTGQWMRHVIEFNNDSFSGNPFELDLTVDFFHPESNRTLRLPGYFAGNNTWKVAFMPDAQGRWEYTTISGDPDLNQVKGSLTCIPSNLPGMLKADVIHPKKWKFTDGSYVVPMAFRFDLFLEDGSVRRFTEIADFLKNEVKAHMLEFRLTNEGGNPAFPIFKGDWRNHQFNLPLWDRLEERMKILTERGLGIHLMFYSDDAGKPEWAPYSDTEKLLIRYVVARLAAYPVVWFNTGIDIVEYRGRSMLDKLKDRSWVNWFGEQIRSLDPYQHPVSSRYGGGSGRMIMAGQTFDSRGARQAFIKDMQRYFEIASVPVSMDDAWRENGPPKYDYKNFRPADIRRASWKCVMAGGLGALIRGSKFHNNDSYFRMANFEKDLESEQWLRLVNPFIEKRLGDSFGEMVPDQSLVSNGYCITDPFRKKILYYYLGTKDKWDRGKKGPLILKLSKIKKNYQAFWFDPRTGIAKDLGRFNGGKDHTIMPPSDDDWVLLLNASS